jgi:hypothetical protein
MSQAITLRVCPSRHPWCHRRKSFQNLQFVLAPGGITVCTFSHTRKHYQHRPFETERQYALALFVLFFCLFCLPCETS